MANLIEGREDIEFDSSRHDDKQLIYEASNPTLKAFSTKNKANYWIKKLCKNI